MDKFDITPEALEERRVQACNKELMDLMKKYNCNLECSITIGQGLIAPQIFVVANKEPIKADEEPKIPMPPVQS